MDRNRAALNWGSRWPRDLSPSSRSWSWPDRTAHCTGLPGRNTSTTNMKHACGLSLALLLIALAAGQDPQPQPKASDSAEPKKPLRLFEQEPYDLLRFKDGKEQKVQLLVLKGRRFPDKPRATDKLVVKT